MQRTKRISPLVCTMVCLCARLWRTALVENHSVVNVTRGHGCSVSAQRFPLWSCSLPLHGAIFHPCLCCFSWLWPRAFSAWAVRVEVDRRRNYHRCLGPHLPSGAVSRSVSAKRLRLQLKERGQQFIRPNDLASAVVAMGVNAEHGPAGPLPVRRVAPRPAGGAELVS